MIQLTQKQAGLISTNTIYINLYDKEDITYALFGLTSQLTGKTTYISPASIDTTNKERYIKMVIYLTTVVNNPTIGFMTMGTTDYPYGFYDVTIYKNSSGTNIDPAGLTVVFQGLGNLTQSGHPAVTYTEYTTNDSDTETVYITN